MTHAIFQKVDLSKLPNSVQRDIKEFAQENNQPPAETVYDALHYHLMWNGIIGYTSVLAEIFQAQKEEN